jgi:uncharacterized membrane protein YgdD (TMEM256/DUF423 family)
MKLSLIAGCLFCLVGVILGAYGAHGLAQVLTERQLRVFEIGVKFQFYHGIGLLAVAFIHEKVNSRLSFLSIIFILIGTLLFSGSLYLLSLYQTSWLGPITPFGGLLLILGWSTLLIAIFRSDFSVTPKE